MTPQKAIEILTAMIAVLEQPADERPTNCLCGAYTYAINPDINGGEAKIWTPNYRGMEEIGLFRPEEPHNNLYWFETGDVDIRIKYCKKAIKEWEKQL